MEHRLTNTRKNYRPGEIVVDGRSLIELGVYASKRPIIEAPERSVDLHTSIGRDGYLVIDHGTYGMRKGQCDISVRCTNEEERENTRSFLYSLVGREHVWEFYNHPFGSFRGIVEVALEDNSKVGYHLKGSLSFKLQPYRRLFNGERNGLRLQKNDSFRFDKGRLMMKYHLVGSGNFTLVIGGKRYEFQNVPNGTLIFDCVNYTVWQQRPGGVLLPFNHVKRAKSFPNYQSLEQITWEGNVNVTVDYVWECV